MHVFCFVFIRAYFIVGFENVSMKLTSAWHLL